MKLLVGLIALVLTATPVLAGQHIEHEGSEHRDRYERHYDGYNRHPEYGIIGGIILGAVAYHEFTEQPKATSYPEYYGSNYYNQPVCWSETRYNYWGRPYYVQVCR